MGLERINEIRKQKKMSINQLSELSGVPKGTLSKITAGITTNPNLDTLKAIARTLECTLDDFDDKKISAPEPEEPESEADIEKKAKFLYETLLAAGWVKKEQPLTPKQIDVLAAVINILAASFED